MNQPETPATDDLQPGVARFRATARRAPKVGVFLTFGGLVGAIVAFILVMVHQGVDSTDPHASDDLGVWIMVVFFFSVAVGVALAGVLALVLDRVRRRRAALVTVERGSVEVVQESASDAGESGAVVNEGIAADSEVTENSSPDDGGRA